MGRVETRAVWQRELVGPEMAYVEETRTCADGHIVLSLAPSRRKGMRPIQARWTTRAIRCA
jgi:hypothetical protein